VLLYIYIAGEKARRHQRGHSSLVVRRKRIEREIEREDREREVEREDRERGRERG
jgi:hypothetical protein